LEQSPLASFFPKGWDLSRIDACCALPPESIGVRQDFWHSHFALECCDDAAAADVAAGHAVADRIRIAREEGRPLALLLPAGPAGMFRWLVYFLKQWNVGCAHVHLFSMGEWCDKDGNEPGLDEAISLQSALSELLLRPLGALAVPVAQRSFATQRSLPKYAQKIADLKAHGASLVMVYRIGRMMGIGFWEPQLAAGFESEEDWKAQYYRKSVSLHALTVEQYALERFSGRTALVPCFANAVGPALFLNCDYAIGCCDSPWQAAALWTSLRHGPNVWIPSSFIPTLPGRLYYAKELAGPLGVKHE
jgi:glucosamine-6-phosphate deaminase